MSTRLFKYFCKDRVDVIENKQIRFTQPSLFDDPFETFPYIQAIIGENRLNGWLKEQIESVETRTQIMDFLNDKLKMYAPDVPPDMLDQIRETCLPLVEFLVKRQAFSIGESVLGLETKESRRTIQESLKKHLSQRIGILSLTERPDNLLMWSHYTEGHAGFVMEFYPDHPFFRDGLPNNERLCQSRKVKYSGTRPTIAGFTPDQEADDILNTIADAFILTKSIEWEYEQEWRLIRDLGDSPDNHGELVLFQLPPKCVASVILGCRMPEKNETRIRSALAQQEFSHVSLGKAEIDLRKFKINIIDSN